MQKLNVKTKYRREVLPLRQDKGTDGSKKEGKIKSVEIVSESII